MKPANEKSIENFESVEYEKVNFNRPYSSFPTSIEKTLRTNSYTLYICTVIITEIGILKFLSVTARKKGQNEILIPPKVLKCDFT